MCLSQTCKALTKCRHFFMPYVNRGLRDSRRVSEAIVAQEQRSKGETKRRNCFSETIYWDSSFSRTSHHRARAQAHEEGIWPWFLTTIKHKPLFVPKPCKCVLCGLVSGSQPNCRGFDSHLKFVKFFFQANELLYKVKSFETCGDL